MDEKGSLLGDEKLQVIGVGLPRTGTMSLQTALEMLGYTPCHHFKHMMSDDSFPYPKVRLWQKAARSTDPVERQQLLRKIYSDSGCKAAVDYPTSLFVEDLVKLYPNAKFIHGVRSSPQAWRTSFNATVGKMFEPLMWYSCMLLPLMRFALQPLIAGFQIRTKDSLGVSVYSTEDDVEIYHRHNEWVRRVVPKEKMLEFEPKDGFEPLCKFLGVPVPTDEAGNKLEYPHVNDTESLQRGLWFFTYLGWLTWIAAAGILFASIKLVQRFW